MWKYIVVSMIAAVMLLPLAAFADEGGSATATLTFDAVINTIVTDNWGDLTIDQNTTDYASIEWLAANYIGTPIDWGDPANTNDITVTVQSITDFKVYSSYSGIATGFTVPTDLANADTFLYLDSFALKYYLVATPTAHGMTDGAATTNLTLLTWTGTSTIGTTGETHNYDVKWDPGQLPALSATENVALTIYFVVTDPSA